MKKKFFTLFALLLCLCSGAWGNYKSETVGSVTTLTWDFGEYSTKVSSPSTGGVQYGTTGLWIYGGSEISASAGYKSGGNSDTNNKYRYITYTPSNNGTLKVFFCSNSNTSGAGRYAVIGTQVNSSDPSVVGTDGVIAFGECTETSESSDFEIVNCSGSVSASTLYYIYTRGSVQIRKIEYSYEVAAVAAPSTPTFIQDGGDVNGRATVTISSENATKIYYVWSNSSTAPTKGDASYNEESGSSFDATVPNETVTKYLHAYGWNNYNSGTATDIYSKSFNITKVKDEAGLTYAETAVTKDAGSGTYTNTLTNPHSITVTYAITNTGTGSTIDAETGEVTIGNTAGTETITATSAETSDYQAGEATYTLTVNKTCAAPVISFRGYNYEHAGYEFVATCETDGATLQYRLKNNNTYTGCTAGEPFYLVGTGANTNADQVIVKATKSGWTEKATTTTYYLNAAPSLTSPETLIPAFTNDDNNSFRNHAYKYRSVTIGEESNGASVGGTNGIGQLKIRTNQTWDGIGNSINLYVNRGYKVTNVTITAKTNNTDEAKVVKVSKLYVDNMENEVVSWPGKDVVFPISSAENGTACSTGEINATSKIKFVFAAGGSGTMHTQLLAAITVTYERLTESISTTTAAANERYYATHVAANNLDFTDVSGSMTAYIATGLNATNKAVVIEAVDKVPAGAAILVKAAVKGATVSVPLATSDVAALVNNEFIEGDGSTVVTVSDGYYFLSADQFHLANSGTLQSGKAYLHVGGGAARQLAIGFDDEPTSIQTVNDDVKNLLDGEFYNVAGQRVALPKKGLYIVNGRKVIVK